LYYDLKQQPTWFTMWSIILQIRVAGSDQTVLATPVILKPAFASRKEFCAIMEA
jgi:hypothetical protein